MRMNLRKPVEPRAEPTMEEDIASAVMTMKQYAPPNHADRISSTSKVMCDAVRKVLTDTGSSLDERVAELHARVKDVQVRQVEDPLRGIRR